MIFKNFYLLTSVHPSRLCLRPVNVYKLYKLSVALNYKTTPQKDPPEDGKKADKPRKVVAFRIR